MFCENCDTEIDINSDTCLGCGKTVERKTAKRIDFRKIDPVNFGWWLLGFCFPIVGFILYLVWKKEKPLISKKILFGVLVAIIIPIIIFLIALIIFLIRFNYAIIAGFFSLLF